MYILKRKLNVFQALIISLYFPKPLAVSIAEQKLGKSKKTESCKRGNQENIDQKLCCSFFGPVINYPRLPPSLFSLSMFVSFSFYGISLSLASMLCFQLGLTHFVYLEIFRWWRISLGGCAYSWIIPDSVQGS